MSYWTLIIEWGNLTWDNIITNTSEFMLKNILASASLIAPKPWWKKTISNLNQITKFKLSVLNAIVVFTAYNFYPLPLVCTYSTTHLFMASLSLSMSTQVFNQVIQVQRDKLMKRTSQRPLVKGMNRNLAILIGILLGTLGLEELYRKYGTNTALVGFSIFGGYLLLYTPMKRFTAWNTLVGAVIGALPVYLGWVAAGRDVFAIQPFAMFAYMVAWQHQHFYGIRWIYFDDYNKGGFRMEMSKNRAVIITVISLIIAMVAINGVFIKEQSPLVRQLGCITNASILYFYGIRSSFKFLNNEITAKQFKMHSYYHFLYFLVICLFVTGYRIIKKNRKLQDLTNTQISKLSVKNVSSIS